MTAVLLLASWTLLTPAFTDFEAEAEPALTAFAQGDWLAGLQQLPLYATATLLVAPIARLTQLSGGGELALFRAVAVPGAVVVVTTAVLAGAWLRAAGRPRTEQLIGVLLLAASPLLSHAWQLGHFEEALVTGIGLAAVLLAAQDRTGTILLAGALVGLAAGAKLWAIVLVPVVLAAAPSVRRRVQAGAAAAIAGLIAIFPAVYALRSSFAEMVTATGTGPFTTGNLWWFLGSANPAWVPQDPTSGTVVERFEGPRLAPTLVAEHGHEGVVILAAGLAAVWWWRQRRTVSSHDRTTAALWLAAAVLWWRAVPDPWFQAYYLVPAFTCVVLAGTRSGRLPAVAVITWLTFWGLNLQNGPGMDLSPDVRSAIMLAVTVPTGVWLVLRAMRPMS